MVIVLWLINQQKKPNPLMLVTWMAPPAGHSAHSESDVWIWNLFGPVHLCL